MTLFRPVALDLYIAASARPRFFQAIAFFIVRDRDARADRQQKLFSWGHDDHFRDFLTEPFGHAERFVVAGFRHEDEKFVAPEPADGIRRTDRLADESRDPPEDLITDEPWVSLTALNLSMSKSMRAGVLLYRRARSHSFSASSKKRRRLRSPVRSSVVASAFIWSKRSEF